MEKNKNGMGDEVKESIQGRHREGENWGEKWKETAIFQFSGFKDRRTM